jgi:HPt (histidine-containing phosphotransfer) domain-containing protein
MPLSDLLDLTTLQNLVELDDGGFGLVAEMTAIFRDDTPRRLRDIYAALDTQDSEGLSRSAHALKGGSGAIGARVLRMLASDLEALGRSGSAAAPEDTRQRLDAAFQEAVAALEAYVRGEGRG